MQDLRPIFPDEFAPGYLSRRARCEGRDDTFNPHCLRAIAPRASTSTAKSEAVDHVAALASVSREVLLLSHTLLPAFHAFSDDYESHMDRPVKHHYEAVVGVRSQKAWNFCPECVREDQDFWWVTYWRRSHQLPGVQHCTKHACSLQSMLSPRFEPLLPGDKYDAIRRRTCSASMERVSFRMASLWDGLIEHGRPISALAARLLLRQRLGDVCFWPTADIISPPQVAAERPTRAPAARPSRRASFALRQRWPEL
jgi:hypothetical protein